MSEVIVRGKARNIKQNKQNRNWFYFNFSFESSSFIFNLTILKRENLSLPLKDGTDQFVICLILLSVFLSKIALYPRTVKRIVTALMPSFLFHCLSLFLPHLRSLPHEKRSIGKLSSFCY